MGRSLTHNLVENMRHHETCTIRSPARFGWEIPRAWSKHWWSYLPSECEKLDWEHIYSQHFSTKCNNENRLYWEKPAFFWNKKKNGFHFSTPQKSSLKTPTRYHISICGFNNRPRNSDPDVSELGGKAFKVVASDGPPKNHGVRFCES